MGSPEKVSENLSMFGGIPAPSRVCCCSLTAGMIQQYFPFILPTKKWAFLLGPQAGSNKPCQTLSSITSISTVTTFFRMRNTASCQTLWLASSRIWWGVSTPLLIIRCSSHVHERAHSLFDSISSRASVSIGINMFPYCSSRNISGVNFPPLVPGGDVGRNLLSQGLRIGMGRAIDLSKLSSLATGIHPSDKVTGFASLPTHLYCACTQAAWVSSSKVHFAESRYVERVVFDQVPKQCYF